jgi:hypothetical protein
MHAPGSRSRAERGWLWEGKKKRKGQKVLIKGRNIITKYNFKLIINLSIEKAYGFIINLSKPNASLKVRKNAAFTGNWIQQESRNTSVRVGLFIFRRARSGDSVLQLSVTQQLLWVEWRPHEPEPPFGANPY